MIHKKQQYLINFLDDLISLYLFFLNILKTINAKIILVVNSRPNRNATLPIIEVNPKIEKIQAESNNELKSNFIVEK